jgi:hypothetical protein
MNEPHLYFSTATSDHTIFSHSYFRVATTPHQDYPSASIRSDNHGDQWAWSIRACALCTFYNAEQR